MKFQIKRFSKLLFLFASVCILFFASCNQTGKISENDIVILYTNDVHCSIDENIGYVGLVEYKTMIQQKTPFVTLVDAGDAIQGSSIGSLSKGESIIEIMNEAGYDVAVPGNHEFDYGWERFFQLSEELNCGYVSCNFRQKLSDEAYQQLFFEPYKIIEYNNKKVAFVGICTPETFFKSSSTNFEDKNGERLCYFDGENDEKELYSSVQNAINSARSEGADFVILVAHIGENRVTEKWNAMNVVKNTFGADILIDGHSHETTPSMKVQNSSGKNVIITQTGTKFKNIGQLTIKQNGKISAKLINSVPKAKSNLPKNPDVIKMQNLIASIRENFNKILSQKIGETDFDLVAIDSFGRWLVRNNETNLSDLVSDAYRIVCKTDIGIINAGGLRNNIKKGEITYGDVLSVHPFENKIFVFEISGKTLKDELEFGVKKYPNSSGGFLQVSGLSFKIDSHLPSPVQDDRSFVGEYRVHDIFVNGEELDLDKNYTVATTDFVVLDNGDGHSFSDAKVVCEKGIDCDVGCEYIKMLGGKIPESYKNENGQGRIKIK